MIRRILSCTVLSVVALLAGCTTFAPTIPEGYTGPKAKLSDSAMVYSNSKANFYDAEQVNDAPINSSSSETFKRNQGRGMVMTPYFVDRELVADKPVKIAVRARTYFAAPILAMTSTVYEVKGVVEFTPAANGHYTVRGQLGPTYSAVWIENDATHRPVGEKVEIKGSAKLGFFEK